MARVGRLGGALLVETGGAWHVVGHFKEPCALPAAPVLAPPWLAIDLEGEPLLALLHARLLIERTGGVSERLWRLVTHAQDGEVDARWLAATPAHVWEVVKDAVLRCS